MLIGKRYLHTKNQQDHLDHINPIVLRTDGRADKENYKEAAVQSKLFPVWLRNQFISTGLETVLSHTEKLCIALYYRQFSKNIKIKILKLKPVL